jgi:hypothetical protein
MRELLKREIEAPKFGPMITARGCMWVKVSGFARAAPKDFPDEAVKESQGGGWNVISLHECKGQSCHPVVPLRADVPAKPILSELASEKGIPTQSDRAGADWKL